MSTRALLSVAAALTAVAALPATAAAAPCGGSFQYDAEGYEWDLKLPTGEFPVLGAFNDGGGNAPTGTPPGPRSTVDSYDWWGGLFVGGQTPANVYATTAPGADTCFEEESGRELVLPKKTIDGLEVQRKVYVSARGLPGARTLTIVRNPGSGPRTTSIQTGETLTLGIYSGDLGSDDDTAVRSSSTGDAVLTAEDRWTVTSDHSPGGTNNDLALAHVFDGRGGADRIDFVTQTNTENGEKDDLAYRWDGMTIPAGGTAAYLSYEIQRGVPGADGAAEDEAARLAAVAYDANLPQVYAGMSDQEIAAVRNWPLPAPAVAFTASARPTDREAVAFSAAGSTASSVPGSCSGLSYAWDFGDGSTATGESASHRFTAGTHTVKVFATNACGGSATRAETVTVADATAPAAALKVPKSSRLEGLRVRLRSSEGGAAKLAARIRGGRTLAKARVSLRAGQLRTVRLKANRRLAAALRGRRVKVTLAVTITDPAGNAAKLSRRIQVRI